MNDVQQISHLDLVHFKINNLLTQLKGKTSAAPEIQKFFVCCLDRRLEGVDLKQSCNILLATLT